MFNTSTLVVCVIAALVVAFVIWATRNWDTSISVMSPEVYKPSPEKVLYEKIGRLQHEVNEMQGVLLTYNNDNVRNEYWELKAQLQMAENEMQSKYGHSRKVVSFTRRA